MAEEITGIPRGLVYWSTPNQRHIGGIAIEVLGVIYPASFNAVTFADSIQAAEMLSMVQAAIDTKQQITLSGGWATGTVPDATYGPRGDFRISSLTVFGYTWGPSYLSK